MTGSSVTGTDATGMAGPWPGVGRVLAGRYRLERHIATGSVGTVWQATDATLERTVAVKLLHPHLSSEKDLARFRLEALAAAQIGHASVVHVFDIDRDGDLVFLTMEYVAGPDLRVFADGRALPPLVVAAIGRQVAEAIGEAHRRDLVHRDLKPSNILLGRAGVVKVGDFGLAKILSATTNLTQTGTMLGSPAYVAPEQLTGDAVHGRTDVYALGVVLWELVTGQRAYQRDSAMASAMSRLVDGLPRASEVVEDIPPALDDVIARANRREPRERFSDGTVMADALAELVPRPVDVVAAVVSPGKPAVQG